MRGVPAALGILAAALATLPSAALTQERVLRGLGIDERLDEPSHLPSAVNAPPELFVRLAVPRESVEVEPSVYSFDRLDERMSALEGVQVLLALEGMPKTAEGSEAFRRYVLAVSERYRGRVAGYVLGELDEGSEAPEIATYAFLLKLAAIQIRSIDEGAVVLESHLRPAEPAFFEALYREEIAVYVDGLALDREELPAASFEDRLRAVQEIARRTDSSAQVIVTGTPSTAPRLLVEAFQNLAAGVPLTTFRARPDVVEALLEMDEILDLLTSNLLPLDARESDVGFSLPGVSHRVFFDPSSGSTYLVYWREGESPEAGSVEITMKTFAPDAPRLRDPVGGRGLALSGFSFDPETRMAAVAAPLVEEPLILEFPSMAFGASVSARAGLDVNQIVARHQQAQRRQDDLVENYVARVTDAIHFRPTPSDAFDVVIESRFYFDRRGSEWEEISFSFNGARWGADRPPFPLLQPEKVLSLPLDLRLEGDYAYELVGRESVGERPAYVVRFRPLAENRSLYRGLVFIDEESFLKLKVEAVQTRLSAPVVSSDEVYSYERQAERDGLPLYLLTRLQSKQLVLIAGRNLLVEKESRFQDFEVNPPNFQELRDAARESDRIMLKDTDQGLRYFVKRGGERQVVDELTQTAKALALGTILDPSFDFPLPILGLNYLDFDFLETNSQFALLFGGVFVLGNLQKPGLFGGRFDANVDFFGFAIKSNDVVFDSNGKIEDESLTTVPGSLGAALGFQATTFQKLTGRYDLRYDYYARSDLTAEDFATPTSTFTHGAGLGYEYRRGGYSVVASGAYNRRSTWEPWGDVDTFEPSTRSYWKYRATLGKDFFFETLHKLHFDVGFFGGERLDRFTKYQFGLFDETRVHGMPSTAVRFSELVLARASYSFNLFEQFRFDVFYDRVWGDDPEGGFDWVPFSGVGVAMNFRGPRRTVIRFDFGKSILPPELRGAGTMVGQIQILKPL